MFLNNYLYESRGTFLRIMKLSMFVKTNHSFCPLCWLKVEISLKVIIWLVFHLNYMSLTVPGSLPIFGTCLLFINYVGIKTEFEILKGENNLIHCFY